MVRCQPAASVAVGSTVGGPPALVTTMSVLPNASAAAATIAAASAVDASAATCATSTPWAARISSAAAARRPSSRDQMSRRQPSAASASAEARPSPEVPPPTIAVRPLSPRSIGLLVLELERPQLAQPLGDDDRVVAGLEAEIRRRIDERPTVPCHGQQRRVVLAAQPRGQLVDREPHVGVGQHHPI